MYMLVTYIILIDQCNGKKLPLRIYGGKDVNQHQHPYVVRLEIQHSANSTNEKIFPTRHDHLCTASALTATWSVTAAHCVTDLSDLKMGAPYSLSKLVIRYGTVHNSPWRNYTLSDVLATVPHPLYANAEYGSNPMVKNDIGLLKTEPILLKRYMKISAVDYKSLYGHEAVFLGFGITARVTTKGKMISGTTLMLDKPLQYFKGLMSKCLKTENLLPAICVVAGCGDVIAVCGGDSGGPLLHPSGVAGVLSVGFLTGYCMDPAPKRPVDYAAIVLPISPYIEWIVSYLNV